MSSDYRIQRHAYENQERYIFLGVGKYDIPEIRPETISDDIEWVGFNYARTIVKAQDRPEDKALHFFIDDYQFSRLWQRPDEMLQVLGQFEAVSTPDFSIYTDFPKAVQIYSHFKKHWLAAYWQMNGIKVIPTITWATPDSYDWCFDGEPEGSPVIVSSVGTQKNKESRQLFIDGYNEMMRRLHPSKVLFSGLIPEGIDDSNIVKIDEFQLRFRKLEAKNGVVRNGV